MENLNNNRREDWLEDALKNRSTMGAYLYSFVVS